MLNISDIRFEATGRCRYASFFAYLGNNRDMRIAELELDETNSFAEWVHVEKPYRRLKVATKLYDFAESKLGYSLRPSESLSIMAKSFWEKRLAVQMNHN